MNQVAPKSWFLIDSSSYTSHQSTAGCWLVATTGFCLLGFLIPKKCNKHLVLTWNGWDEPNIWILRRQLDAERFIVKASSGPRYVVTCKVKLDKSKLVSGSRVSLDMTTLTIMRLLPREVEMLMMLMFFFLFFWGGAGRRWMISKSKKVNQILRWDAVKRIDADTATVDKIRVTTWQCEKLSESHESQQLGYAIGFLLRDG